MKPAPAIARICCLVAALVAALPAAGRTTLKMATLVPEGSVWDKVLREMGADVGSATGGDVSIRIYPGGVAGDEPDIVRKMRLGQLHAAALTVTGLGQIDSGFEAFQIPMFFDSYDELFAVLDALRPTLAERLDQKGFVLLNWGLGGWVHFFSKQPIRTVDDLRRQKVFTWAGNDAMVQLWRRNRFEPVALAATDILTGLETGMVEALPTTPLAALSLQWFRQTPYMQELGLAPLVGATVVTRRAWDRLTPAEQKVLQDAAHRAETTLEKEIPTQDARAVEEMQRRGLTVVATPPGEREAWRKAAVEFTAVMRDMMESKDLLDQAQQARDAFRARAGGK